MARRLKLTEKEKQAIKRLKELAETWPDSLWLFADGHTLSVMRKHIGAKMVTHFGGGYDPDFVVAEIDIDNDGGDW